jgi:hypothetical protein
LVVPALEGELQLSLADFDEFGAPLHEGLDGGKDGVGDEGPLAFFSGVDDVGEAIIDLSPSFSALDGVVEILDALFNVSVEHVVDVDLGLAALDYLVRDLVQQVRDAVVGVVELRMVPDHPHAQQQLRQHVGDLLGLGLLQLAAGLE